MPRSLMFKVSAAVVLLLLSGTATPVSADILLTPFIGVSFNPNATFNNVGDFTENLKEKVTFGATATWVGGGVVGFEIDFGSTPNFFEIEAGPNDFDFGDGNITTLMTNLVLIGTSSGQRVRPYASGGVGLLRTNVDAGDLFESVNSNDFGANVGAGIYGFFSDSVGIRGDIRYFRGLQQSDEDLDFSDLDFWRASFGVTVRFGG